MRLPLEDDTLIIGPILSRESRVLLVPKDHPLAALPSVRYDELAGWPVRVAAGELVHPTVSSFLHHHPSPDVRAVPIVDLPPSETALVWLAPVRVPPSRR